MYSVSLTYLQHRLKIVLLSFNLLENLILMAVGDLRLKYACGPLGVKNQSDRIDMRAHLVLCRVVNKRRKDESHPKLSC